MPPGITTGITTTTPRRFPSTTGAIATPTTTADRVTAMATSDAVRRALLAALAAAALAAALVTITSASSAGRSRPSPHWTSATIASGAATLTYPSSWKPIPGDSGTVSVALRDRAGRYRGYLNVTPRQGAERRAGWAAFRIHRNLEEGDRQVRELTASQDVAFADARGSCVEDEYRSRVGANPYHELACIVAGRRSTSVFIGAALVPDWRTLGPTIRRAAAAFVER